MIRIAWGTGRAGTETSSFDAALASAGLHQYNLRTLSSVIPAETQVAAVDTAGDLGPAGEALDVVLARRTSPPGARAAAGLAWTDRSGPGLFYEAGDRDPETVRERLRTGIERGCELRGYGETDFERRVVTADPSPDRYRTAVVVAAFGGSTPLL